MATSLMFLLCFFLLVARAWAGIDRIPTDPNYDYLQVADTNFWELVRTDPYFHIDAPLLAAVASLFSIDHQAVAANIVVHLVWSACALAVFMAIRRSTKSPLVASSTGLVLVLSPWASQSMLGNYGNIRWPILVAMLIVCSQELLSTSPRRSVLWASSATAALTNPLAGILVIPLFVTWIQRSQKCFKTAISVLSAPLLVFIVNLFLTGGSGHSAKTTWLWSGAGLFWTSGQILPSAVAVSGLFLFLFFKSKMQEDGTFGAVLLASALALALASYALGGIADRYFFGPAALSGVGILLLLHSLRSEVTIRRFLFVVVLSISLIPAAKWFSVFPWLRSGVPWSEQVQLARRECEDLRRVSVELVTSDGITLTNPVPCVVLASEDR